MATKSEILQQAETVRTMTEENGNTAELVGSILKLIINYAADADSAEVTARNRAIAAAIKSIPVFGWIAAGIGAYRDGHRDFFADGRVGWRRDVRAA